VSSNKYLDSSNSPHEMKEKKRKEKKAMKIETIATKA
jgi:hypothetical protein